MSCETCRLWLGKNLTHGSVCCPLLINTKCRRCCGSGHEGSNCPTNSMAIHPIYIEELIPQDVKDMYGIVSQTEYVKPTINVMPHPVRCIEIVNQDKWIREFMKQQKLQTARKREDNLAKIYDWSHENGLKINLINQE